MAVTAIPIVVQRGKTERYPTAAGQTFVAGVLVYNNSGATVCGANPASILGVPLNDAAVVPDTTNTLVSEATEESRWWMSLGNSNTAANVTPVEATHVGQSYGVTATASTGLYWYVDTYKTDSDARVFVHEVDTTQNRVLVSVLAANRQVAP